MRKNDFYKTWFEARDTAENFDFRFETDVLNNPENPWMRALIEITGNPEFRFSDYFPVDEGNSIRFYLEDPPFQEHHIRWKSFSVPAHLINDISVEDAIVHLMDQLSQDCAYIVEGYRELADHIEWMNNEMIATHDYKRLEHYNIMMEDDYYE